MSPRIIAFIALLLPALLLPASAPAQEPAPAGARMSVYLLTMGQGDQVWEKFGHNALWIHDPAAGTDYVYNYGVFDFDSPGYWSRFLKGDWLYQLAVADIDQTMAQYQYLNRTVVAQELNLSPGQAAELQEFLEWNALPQNREYNYDYYRDNCSTRIRDALDGVIGDQLRAATAGEPTGTTYRFHSRRLIADDAVTYTGLVAGLGPAADRPLSEWEEMFLPAEVRRQAAALRLENGAPLVAAEHVLYEAADRAPERAEPPGWTLRYLLIGLLLAALFVGLGRAAVGGAVARFAFSLTAAVWALVVGTGGVLLVALWAFTNHSIAYANENLFQFSPLALPLVLLVPALAFGLRWAARPALWLALAVAASSILGLVLQLLPSLDQGNGEIIALLLPPNLALAWVVSRMAAAAPARAPRRESAPQPAGRS